jgi:hypothetical protein
MAIPGSKRKDQFTRLQEYYSQRESDLAHKHKVDMKNQRENHETEIEKLRASATEEIKINKEQMKEKFTAQEQKFQRDIDNLKKFYQKKLEKASSS